MTTAVITRPVLTEKSQTLSGTLNQFVFIVEKTANKHAIKSAVEQQFGVKVKGVNTTRMPAKLKTRFTKRGLQKGRRPAYKKAIVTLRPGETIEFYGDQE